MKYKIDQVVRVVDDDPKYPHCIGRVGTIVSCYTEKLYKVKFDFILPYDKSSNNEGDYLRDFHYDELVIDKEFNIKNLLNQIDSMESTNGKS